MFTAEWSGPDRVLRPILEEVISDRGDMELVIVDVDDHIEVAEEYKIRSVPTVSVFVGGQPVNEVVGALPHARLAEELEVGLVSGS